MAEPIRAARPTARRPRAAATEKRTRLLDATEAIILRDGYAAVSSRHVAAAAGMNASLVHYYYPTLDDLLVAVLRRRAVTNVTRMAEAMASAEPLRAWWTLVSDERGAALSLELLAAANHRPALSAEVGEFAREVRRMHVESLQALLPQYGIDPTEIPPALVAAAVQGLAFSIVSDATAGYDTDTDVARAGMVGLLTRLEAKRREQQT